MAISDDNARLLFYKQYCLVEIRDSAEKTARFLVGVILPQGDKLDK
jgi:hypothetical protein